MVRAISDYTGSSPAPSAAPRPRPPGNMVYSVRDQADYTGPGPAPSTSPRPPQSPQYYNTTIAKPSGQPQGGNQVNIYKPQNPHTLSPQQTNAEYNYNQALAYQQADPRYAGKQYQRAGLSSSAGTSYLGAADAANRFTAGMAAAENARMQDAYTNAGIGLSDAEQRSQLALALAGLQDDAAQRDYMHQMQSMRNATGFMGDMMGGFLGGSGPLSGLL